MKFSSNPKARNIITYGVVGLWAVSVVGQMASSVFGFTWVTPPGLNEIGTGVIMAILARNHQVSKAEKEAESID